MAALNATAKAALRAAGVTQAEWARANFMSDGKWSGDICGCPDSGRCANGYHHFGPDDCGCLPVLLEQFLAGEGLFARESTDDEAEAYREQAEREEADAR